MKRKKAKRLLLCSAVTVIVCIIMQVQSNAENADTFINAEYVSYCEDAGKQYGICPELLEAIMEAESSGDPRAENGNCKGLMQINLTYHSERMDKLGVTDIYDARGNIFLAADYLSELFLEYGDVGTVLMVYNGNRDALIRSNALNYTEYAQRIVKRSEELERLHGK